MLNASQNPATTTSTARAARMSTRNRVLFFVVAWAIVLMPFLFWRSTWFGRPLAPEQMAQYLRDDKKPRDIQHALVQMGELMARHDSSAQRWYPDLVLLAANPVEEVRNTDAWVMGQDSSRPEFHAALLKMLQDSSPTVRANAALSLIRFGDNSGREALVNVLQPARVAAPRAGRVLDLGRTSAAIHENGVVAKLDADGSAVEIRSPIGGRIRSFSVAEGAQVAAGAEIATIDPGEEQVWEALRGLYLIGERDDLLAIRAYQRALPDMPDRVRQQAIETEKAILKRAGNQ